MSQLYPIPRHYRDSGDLIAEQGQTSFGPFDFVLFDLLDAIALVKPAAATEYEPVEGGYTIVPTDELPGLFSITLSLGLNEGDALRVVGRRLHERLTNVTQGGAVRAVSLETELDRMSAVLQELRRDLDGVQPDVNLIVAVEAAEAFRDAAEGFRDEAETLRAETLVFRDAAEDFAEAAQAAAEFEVATFANATSEDDAGDLNNTQLMTPRRAAQMIDVRTQRRKTMARVVIAGTTLTINETDHAGKYLVFTNAANCTVTIPADLPDNMVFQCRANGAAGIVFVADGTTLTAEALELAQHKGCTWVHAGANVWEGTGGLA